VIDYLKQTEFINLYAGFNEVDDILAHRKDIPTFQKSEAKVASVHIHEFWLSGSHDLAVIVLDPLQPFILNERVQPICLNNGKSEFSHKTASIIAGYGKQLSKRNDNGVRKVRLAQD
jgi:hypothetical protein